MTEDTKPTPSTAEEGARAKTDALINHEPTEREKSDFYNKHTKEKERRRHYIDAAHYCVIYFQTKEQIETFLSEIGVNLEESLIDGRYFNGFDIAEKLGINIEKIELKDLGKFQSSKLIKDENILAK